MIDFVEVCRLNKTQPLTFMHLLVFKRVVDISKSVVKSKWFLKKQIKKKYIYILIQHTCIYKISDIMTQIIRNIGIDRYHESIRLDKYHVH